MSVETVQVFSPFSPSELVKAAKEADRQRQDANLAPAKLDIAGDIVYPLALTSLLGLFPAMLFSSLSPLIVGSVMGLGWGLTNVFKVRRGHRRHHTLLAAQTELNTVWTVQAPRTVAKLVRNIARDLNELPEARRADFRDLWAAISDSCAILRLDPQDERELKRIHQRAHAVRAVRKAELAFEQQLAADQRRALAEAQAQEDRMTISTLRSDNDHDLELARGYAQALTEARLRVARPELELH